MRKRIGLLVLSSLMVFMCVAVFLPLSFAIEDEAERYPTVDRAEAVDKEFVRAAPSIPTIFPKKFGKLEVDITASLIGGYDSNIELKRYDKDGSGFMQMNVGLYGKYPIGDIFLFKGSYELTSIKYFKNSDPDLLDNILGVSLDTKIAEGYTWFVNYYADFVRFPHDKIVNYTMNKIQTGMRQDITSWLYQKITYEFFNKHYPHWRTRNSGGILRTEKRDDNRNTISHQTGIYMGERIFIRADNRFFFNDSNEYYLDWFDYWSFKTRGSLTYLLTDKIYGVGSFAYMHTSFYKRGISDGDEDERDNLFIYSASVFYDVIKSVSLGLSFDYSKNYSNENMEQYEDFVVSGGVYCLF